MNVGFAVVVVVLVVVFVAAVLFVGSKPLK